MCSPWSRGRTRGVVRRRPLWKQRHRRRGPRGCGGGGCGMRRPRIAGRKGSRGLGNRARQWRPPTVLSCYGAGSMRNRWRGRSRGNRRHNIGRARPHGRWRHKAGALPAVRKPSTCGLRRAAILPVGDIRLVRIIILQARSGEALQSSGADTPNALCPKCRAPGCFAGRRLGLALRRCGVARRVRSQGRGRCVAGRRRGAARSRRRWPHRRRHAADRRDAAVRRPRRGRRAANLRRIVSGLRLWGYGEARAAQSIRELLEEARPRAEPFLRRNLRPSGRPMLHIPQIGLRTLHHNGHLPRILKDATCSLSQRSSPISVRWKSAHALLRTGRSANNVVATRIRVIEGSRFRLKRRGAQAVNFNPKSPGCVVPRSIIDERLCEDVQQGGTTRARVVIVRTAELLELEQRIRQDDRTRVATARATVHVVADREARAHRLPKESGAPQGVATTAHALGAPADVAQLARRTDKQRPTSEDGREPADAAQDPEVPLGKVQLLHHFGLHVLKLLHHHIVLRDGPMQRYHSL
mmetsp:Transcript_116876/g.337722  ORF Transcript_116876/g.337722 Transcript_116876/m.337722 type:complete len:524 (-) Transcript_116876:470-2041(-)